MEDVIRSPSGRYVVTVAPWEARMSLWVEPPTIIDCETGAVLFRFEDLCWSLNQAEWLSDTVVRFDLRKYPGGHWPPQVSATLDCEARTGLVENQPRPFKSLESRLEQTLSWPQPEPAEPLRGFSGFLKRVYRVWRGQY